METKENYEICRKPWSVPYFPYGLRSLCTGQESLRELHAPLQASGMKVHLVGGAFEAGELDAKRAIDQASRLAAML